MKTEQLKKQLRELCPRDFIKDIDEAITAAEKYHKGQKRLSGEPYINHCIRTAITCAQMGMDTNSIITALLHNSITNDIPNREEIFTDIKKIFGQDVSTLLSSLNEISKATASPDTDYKIITKFILNNAKDIRPILIKLADNLDNVRTIEFMPSERLSTKLQKILHIYAPLAEYLNLHKIKKELEERTLSIYRPEIYEMIKEKMEEKNITQESKAKYLEYLTKIFSDISPSPSINGRIKSIYSIYNKQDKYLTEGHSIDINDIPDLMAFRIITDTTDNCFKLLEKVMDNGEIITKAFDDYITHPKKNGYKALQGPVIFPSISNNIVEIQILTHDMYYYNLYGPASHIAYKESQSRYAKPTDKYNWVEDVHKGINNHVSRREKEKSIPIKVDIFPDNVFAFTPKGKIIQLDTGDTAVDFAYKVHTDVGNSMVNAKVNGKAVKLDYKIETGDTVEIKTQSGKVSVKADWIKYANSPSTQYKIQKAWKNY